MVEGGFSLDKNKDLLVYLFKRDAYAERLDYLNRGRSRGE